MNIGKRLRELRQAKGMSQGDIERRAGLLRCYISRAENGHTVPSLATLEKSAAALEVELSKLFVGEEGERNVSRTAEAGSIAVRGGQRLMLFAEMSERDQRLLLDMARKMATTEKRK